jgi:ACT domain-containing protein
VSISIETGDMLEDIERLLQSLTSIDGVRKTKIIGQE